MVLPPLQRGVEIASGYRVIENTETRPNREPVGAVRRMAAKLQTEEGKKIYRQRKKIVAKGGELDSLTRELQAAYNPA